MEAQAINVRGTIKGAGAVVVVVVVDVVGVDVVIGPV